MSDLGQGISLPRIHFNLARREGAGYRIGLLDPQGYADGFAAGVASIPFDETPPAVAVVSPPIGEAAADAELVLNVTDETSLAYVIVFAIWEGQRKPDLVYWRGAFQADYTIGSFVEVLAANHHRLHVKRDAGWPPGEVSLESDVVDGGGNLGVSA